MNKIRKHICVIIELLLMVSIMVGVLCIFLKVVILNGNTYSKIFEETNAYEQIKEIIYNKIDAVLSAKNINYDIKKSIITEDDIKKEAENEISEVIDYLKTDDNNIKPIDKEVYEQRVADIIHSTLKGTAKSNNNLSFNDNFNIQETSINSDKYSVDGMMAAKNGLKDGQDTFNIEKLMSEQDAEARVRKILKQKGLTEEQAIQKAKEKGITEEKALKILADYGITIDGYPVRNEESNGSTKANVNNGNSEKKSNEENDNSSLSRSSAEKDVTSVVQKSADKDNKNSINLLSILENKLIEEADSNIEKEVEKVNLNKILDESRFKKIVKTISVIYKVFWLFMTLPIIFIAALAKVNKGKKIALLKQVGRSIFMVGIILSLICIVSYLLKIYENINIRPTYFKEITSYSIKYFLTVLSMYGAITFGIGLLMFITAVIKVKNQS